VRVIIACGKPGPDSKWCDHLGVPKHLAPVGGRPLLHRTVAQVAGYTDDIVITAPEDDRYQVAGATTVHPDPAGNANEYAGSRPWWSETDRTILLLGDVYFTGTALRTIMAIPPTQPRWYGRFGASRITASRWGEIFAATWIPAVHGTLDMRLVQVANSPEITRPPGWKLYRAVHGVPMGRHRLNGGWTEINDATDDFDVPDTYQRHPAVRRAR
jgi:hypothetical protein